MATLQDLYNSEAYTSTAYIDNLAPITPTLSQQKQSKLNRKTIDKTAKVAPEYTQDVLIGMQDSDSFRTGQFAATRTKIPGLDTYYDGIEGAHYKDGVLQSGIDIQGVDKRTGAYGKSDRVMSAQREYVASVVGKTADTVTEQDFIDVSNQQQIQKLANLGGEADWKAPLIRGVEPTNLTGTYRDENGNIVQESLNVPIQTKSFGTTGKRDLVAFGDQQGLDVTSIDATNPQMNLYAGNVQNELSAGVPASDPTSPLNQYYQAGLQETDNGGANDTDGYFGNLVDNLQFGLGRKAAGIADAFVDASTRAVIEGDKYFNGVTEEEAVKNIVDSSSLFERDPKTGDFIGFDKYKKASEYGYDNTRENNAMKRLAKGWEEGDTAGKAKAVLDAFLTAGPNFVLSSAGEFLTGPLKGFGLMANSADYANQILEDVKGEVTNGRRAAAITGGFGMAVLNKLGADEALGNTKLVQKAIGAVIKTGSESAARKMAKDVAKLALTTVGKGAYEGMEEVAQEVIQKVVAKYGTDKEKELYDGTLGTELFQAFGAGAAAGGSINVAKDTVPAAIKPIAKATGYVGGKVLDAGDKVLDKVFNSGEDTTDSSQDVIKDNPNIDPTEIRAAAEGLQPLNVNLTTASKSDNANTNIGVADDINPQATAAVVANEAIKSPIHKIVDPKDTPEVSKAAEEFDTVFAEIVADLAEGAAVPVDQREEFGLPTDEGEYANAFKQVTAGAMEDINSAVAKLTKAGAGPNKLNAVARRIEALVQIKAAKNSADVRKVIEDAGTEQAVKVRAILGSAQFTPKEIDTYIEENAEELDAQQKKLLVAKSAILSSVKNVGKEKIQGGGTLPGVNQWMSVLGQDKTLDTIAKSKIKNFIGSQRKKLSDFKGSLDAWDIANKMPWTSEGKGNKDFNSNIDYSTPNARAAARSFAINSGKMEATNEPGTVEYGDSSFTDVHKIADMVETLTAEDKAMRLLEDAFNTSSEAQEGTQETQKKSTGKSTPVKDTMPPEASKEAISEGAVNRKVYEAQIADPEVSKLEEAYKKAPDGEKSINAADALTAAMDRVRAEVEARYDIIGRAKETAGEKELRLKLEAKKESRKATKEVLPTVKEVADKIATGKKLSDADLQVQDNGGKAIEDILKKLAEAKAAEQKKKKESKPTVDKVEESTTTDGLEQAQADADEQQRMHEEDLANKAKEANTPQKVTGVTKVSKGTIAEVKKEAKDTLDELSDLEASLPPGLNKIFKEDCTI